MRRLVGKARLSPQSALSRLIEADSGALAIAMAFVLTVLMGAMGIAIDYARSLNVQSTLQAAADAAVLAAARNPSITNQQAATVANAVFTANAKNPLLAATLSTSVSRTSGVDPVTTVAVSTSLPTTFMRLFGKPSMALQASAQAGMAMKYSVVYAAIDMSASLGIAADPAARANLMALTAPYLASTMDPTGCEFACHKRDGWEPGTQTVYQMAKAANIPLREDVLYSAFGTFVDVFLSPTDAGVAAGRKQMGVFGFSDDAQLLVAPSSDTSTIKLGPSSFPEAKRLNTRFDLSLPTIKTQVGAQGTGTAAQPIKMVLLITDGLGWNRNGDPAPNGPVNAALCNSFKDDGITVAVIDVRYQDATGEYWFDNQVSPFYAQIAPALEACASPGMYFVATDSDAKTLAQAFGEAADALRTQLALKQ